MFDVVTADISTPRPPLLGGEDDGGGWDRRDRPAHVPIINEIFSATPRELEWARRILSAFEASRGAATRTAAGEFVDKPVAERARHLLDSA